VYRETQAFALGFLLPGEAGKPVPPERGGVTPTEGRQSEWPGRSLANGGVLKEAIGSMMDAAANANLIRAACRGKAWQNSAKRRINSVSLYDRA